MNSMMESIIQITILGKGKNVKKIIDAMTVGLAGIEAYYMGNIIKYLYRYPKKGTPNNDLLKAGEYIKMLRELYQTKG